MFYTRRLLLEVKKYLSAKEIIVLTGMRRVGKTTLYRILYDQIKTRNKLFLDIENPIQQKIFEEEDYDNIVSNLYELGLDARKKSYLFLDEIQAMPQIVRAIKYLYDHYQIKFFLTGSSSFYLKNVFPESLAGRKYIFELFPLDFQEFLLFKNIQPLQNRYSSFASMDAKKNAIRHEKRKKLYQEYLEYGGFPEVVLAEHRSEKRSKLNDIFKSYFEKDVKSLADFRDIRILRDFILLLMQRIGSKLEIQKLSSEMGVSRETIYSFLSFLEGTYFISLIQPFTKNIDREISGGKKVYLCDTGIVNQFSKISEGSIFENSVFLNLKKNGKIQYYQKRHGGEIDFVLDKKAVFEVKSKGTPYDFRALVKYSQLLGIRQSYLITKEFHKEKGYIPATEL